VVKGTKEDASSLEGENGKHLADRWGLPYREAHTLSIDPAALEIVDREESRRLRVLPLEVGTDGPVFAVAEPSEERFTAVRNLAGDNATFVVVAKETLDALLNSKVFSVSNSTRKPSLFRRTDEDVSAKTAENGDATVEMDEQHHEGHHEEHVPAEPNGNGNGHGTGSAAHAAESSAQLEDLFSQIASGAGSLRAQVDQLSQSLETTQHELREANEQLAEVNRVVESHDQTVAGLRAEIDRLRGELEHSTALNDSMTARLEEVARALLEPSSGDGA
jgi:methyl-accepting chemotaxis protein